MRRRGEAINGVLLLDKPYGVSSNAALQTSRKLLNAAKAGHTGTLDPMATGVLVILIGRAAKAAEYLSSDEKGYIATLRLGATYDTEDITGKVLTQSNNIPSRDAVMSVLGEFLGKIKQIPPMYSALKKDGVRLYDLARQGKTVEIPSREVEVFSINLLTELNEENCFIIDVAVSKGTYIRSLARDIGEYLGCGATLTALERTDTCGFSIEDCVSLDDLDADNVKDYIKSEETAVMHLRECKVTAKQATRFCNGGQLDFSRLHIENIEDNELFRVKCGDTFLGIGIADLENQRLNIKCIINFYK